MIKSEEWKPDKDSFHMKRLTDLYFKDKSRMTPSEIRIVEQQLLFKNKEKDSSKDNIQSSSSFSAFDKKSSDGKSKNSLRDSSPNPPLNK